MPQRFAVDATKRIGLNAERSSEFVQVFGLAVLRDEKPIARTTMVGAKFLGVTATCKDGIADFGDGGGRFFFLGLKESVFDVGRKIERFRRAVLGLDILGRGFF